MSAIPVKIAALIVQSFGVEYTIAEFGSAAQFLHRFDHYISLRNMKDGDVIVVATYIRDETAGSQYVLFDSSVIEGAQDEPIYYMPQLPNDVGYKVTLTQTAGVKRNFYYRSYAI